jgi:hypothetical protein
MVNPLCADRKLKATEKRLSVDGHTPKRMRFFLQPGINITRTSTIREVAGDINEITAFATFRANLRWLYGRDEKAAFLAFPVSQPAIGADISFERAVCRVTTVSTHPFFLYVFHFICLL